MIIVLCYDRLFPFDVASSALHSCRPADIRMYSFIPPLAPTVLCFSGAVRVWVVLGLIDISSQRRDCPIAKTPERPHIISNPFHISYLTSREVSRQPCHLNQSSTPAFSCPFFGGPRRARIRFPSTSQLTGRALLPFVRVQLYDSAEVVLQFAIRSRDCFLDHC